MIDGAPPARDGGFVTAGDGWTYAGTLTFANAAAVFEASRAAAVARGGSRRPGGAWPTPIPRRSR